MPAVPPPPDAAVEFYQRGQKITAAALMALRDRFQRFTAQDIDGSFQAIWGDMVAILGATQLAAAQSAELYVPAVLDESGIKGSSVATVQRQAFVGASSGVPLEDLLTTIPIQAKAASGAGLADPAIEQQALELAEGIYQTQIADAARQASSVGLMTYPRVHWYVRMLVPPSCSRCVVLAGARYRMAEAFKRHPRCDCRLIPVDEDTADSLVTDPNKYFHSLSATEQDHAFTQSGAKAIRDGADINQVVNARRGAAGLTPAGARLTADEARALRNGNEKFGHLQRTKVYGQDVYVTTEGVTKRGVAGKRMGDFTTNKVGRYGQSRTPRLMPESIYQIAGDDREMALNLLKRFGYIA